LLTGSVVQLCTINYIQDISNLPFSFDLQKLTLQLWFLSPEIDSSKNY